MASNKAGKSRKELGEKLHKVRETLDLTQADVAEKADLHANYYARIERGEENPSLIYSNPLLLPPSSQNPS